MTLRSRLLLSALTLSLAITLVLALVVRNAWQESEATRFQQEFDQSIAQLQMTLARAAPAIAAQLSPLCDHDPIIDSALIGLSSGTVASRLLSIRARLPELRASLLLDELVLIASDGSILGGSFGEGALTAEELLQLTEKSLSVPSFRAHPSGNFIAACKKKEGRDWVALLGARRLDPFLREASSSDFLWSLVREASSSGRDLQPEKKGLNPEGSLVREVAIDAIGGSLVRASRSRSSLMAALKYLDGRVFSAVAGTLLGAFLLAFFLSRGLAQPVVAFAERTRQAVTGNVQALPVSGGPELEEAARSFNATLEDLRALRKRLKTTERIAARREVARQVAHEIKNPLSPIRTSIETLRKLRERKSPLFDSYFDETTATVLEEVNRIAKLVGHFTEYAKLPSPQTQAIDLKELASKLVGLHQGIGAPITLKEEELPLVIADREQISQVLTNLLKNALEATEDLETPKIQVELRQAPRTKDIPPSLSPEGVEVLVCDNGPGVAESALEKLFEPYSSTKKDGSGLGLPISQRIAVEHGGDLTYVSATGGGACFILHLPTSGPPTLEEPS